MPTETLSLPTLDEIDEVDNKFGSAMSDLDGFKIEADLFVTADTPARATKEELAAYVAGEDVPETPRNVDEAVIARLLVFADDLLDDLPTIEQDAREIRDAALTAYRHYVIERMRERA